MFFVLKFYLMYLPLLSDHGSDSDSGVIVVPVLNELNQKRLVTRS